MKKILAVLLTLVVMVLGSTPAFAGNKPNLQVQIFPLECSLDSVALGNVNSLQLTPENCIPGQPEPPTIVSPPTSSGGNPSYFPGSHISTSFLADPVLNIPAANLPVADLRGPLIVDPGDTKKEKTANQIQTSAITVSVFVLLSAGLLAMLHAVYTGVLAPAISSGTIRFPWSKK